MVKNQLADEGDMRFRFYPWIRKVPWRRACQPTPVLLPEKSQGQRSLVGYSPQGHKESNMTEGNEHAAINFNVFGENNSFTNP